MESTVKELAKDVAQIKVQVEEVVKTTERLHSNDQRQAEDIRELYKHQEGTKVYVTQILQKLEGLETKIFSLLADQAQTNAKERKDWKELVKYIIGGTIGLLIYHYMGGK